VCVWSCCTADKGTLAQLAFELMDQNRDGELEQSELREVGGVLGMACKIRVVNENRASLAPGAPPSHFSLQLMHSLYDTLRTLMTQCCIQNRASPAPTVRFAWLTADALALRTLTT
jgi:hypothetical protein